MAIVSSTFTLGHVQIDGRRWVYESHTDGKGVVHPYNYLAEIGTDYRAVMLARVPQLETQFAEAVIQEKRADDEGVAQIKLDAYLDGLSDDDAKRLIGYTDDELKVVRIG